MNIRDLNEPHPTAAPWSLTESIRHLAPKTDPIDPATTIITLLEANVATGWHYQSIPDVDELVLCAVALTESVTYTFSASRGLLTASHSSSGTETVLEKVELSSGLTAPEIASIIAAHLVTLSSPNTFEPTQPIQQTP